MTPPCQITQNGGWPPRIADQTCNSPTGCAILKFQFSASPHLKVRYAPGLQNRIGVFLLPCVPLRYALPYSANEQERQRKEKQRVSYLHPEASCDYQHGVQDLISSAPRPCYAGTDKSLDRTVENRIPQTCACCKFGQKRLFSSTVHGAFSFPQEEKRMGGVFQ